MAWSYNNTFPIDKIGTVVAELCYAVNERQAFTNHGKTTWTTPTPADNKQYPTPADMDDVPHYDADCITNPGGNTEWWDLIGDIRTAIEALIAYANIRWCDSNSNETSYYGSTIADYLSLGSYGNTWLSDWLITNAQIYIQIQEVLNLMIYPVSPIRWFDDFGPGSLHDVQEGKSTPENLENSWDAAKAAAPASSIWIDPLYPDRIMLDVGWTQEHTGETIVTGADASIFERNASGLEWNTDLFTGALLDSFLSLYAQNWCAQITIFGDLLIDVTAQVDSEAPTITMTAGSPNPVRLFEDNGTSVGSMWATLGVARAWQKLEITTGEPANRPFANDGKDGFSNTSGVGFMYKTYDDWTPPLHYNPSYKTANVSHGCRIYYDISGDLTYG